MRIEWETRWNKDLDTRTNPTPAEERNCSRDTRQMRYQMARRENMVAISEFIGFKAFLARVKVPGFEDIHTVTVEVVNKQRSVLLCTLPIYPRAGDGLCTNNWSALGKGSESEQTDTGARRTGCCKPTTMQSIQRVIPS